VLREAKKAFRPEDYEEVKRHVIARPLELGFSAKELEELLP